ncbi:MFS transporter [Flexivirga meconopsidis]|uniref:MFS transporter n=1 Tax=Flexivirga meconopsidis TaxID=2977121 RepID=UPI002240CC7C|nr:MFS transporter [Flexivirga meconopsidis]
MSRDGLSGRQRRRAERDRAFTEPIPDTPRTRPMPPRPRERAQDRYDAPPRRVQPPPRTPPASYPNGEAPYEATGDKAADTAPSVHSRADTARAAGRGVKRGAEAMAKFTAAASKGTVRAARKASEAQGAGESGLARLIQVHAFSSAGDAAVAIGLAGTVFFSVSSAQAKGQVLLFLCLTMLPFAIVAPLIGPLLDRFRHGRRWAIGATLAIRAFLCWVLAQAVDDGSAWLFPVALCVLVSSKAYLVTRSAAAPRLLPEQLTLVKANGRLSLAGVVGAGVAGALAGAASAVGGASWALRVAALLFAVGTVLAILLPPRVDSSVGEKPAPLVGLATGAASSRGIGPAVVTALRANTGLRWLSGFLTIFLAFLVRTHPFPGWEDRKTLALALVLGAAGVGNSVGTVMGAALKIASPRVIVLATLVADAVMVVIAAVHFSVVTAVAVGFVAGVGQQLGKLALDSQIQDTVPEHMRTSVFGRSETLLQLSWVIGGIVAVAIPTNAEVGMILAAVVLVAWASAVLIWNAGRSIPVPAKVRAAAPAVRHPGRPPRARPPEPQRADEHHASYDVSYEDSGREPYADEAETIGLRRSEIADHRLPGYDAQRRDRR